MITAESILSWVMHVLESLAPRIGFSFLALVLISWGTRTFIPRLINFYGFRYFEYKKPYLPGILSGWLWSLSTLALATWLGRESAPLAWPGYALVALALQGVWRLDVRFQIIPDRLQLTGGLGVCWIAYAKGLWRDETFLMTTGAALLLVIGLATLSFVYEKVRKVPALGFGDIKLLAWLAPLAGDTMALVMLAALKLALLTVLPTVILGRRAWQGTFAFGPFLVVAFAVMQAAPLWPLAAAGLRGVLP